jgi:hypothetical protein
VKVGGLSSKGLRVKSRSGFLPLSFQSANSRRTRQWAGMFVPLVTTTLTFQTPLVIRGLV